MKWFRQLRQKCAGYLSEKLKKWTKPDDWQVVLSLTLHTAALGLEKGAFIKLAPIKGTCGPITLSGNSLPVFEYLVFHKKIMEFIKVTVEVSRPNRIHFVSKIDSNTAPELHGKTVETQEKFKEPFFRLGESLYGYFPLCRETSTSIRESCAKIAESEPSCYEAGCGDIQDLMKKNIAESIRKTIQ